MSRKITILLFVIAALVAVGILNQNKDNPVTSRLCKAADADSFKSCSNKVNSNQADAIEVTQLITCTGKNACGVDLKNIKRSVSIYGPSSAAGFRRLDTYDYDLITVTESSGVKIYNLFFDENESQPCAPLTDPNNCKGTILISNSNNISIDKVTINHSKKEAVEVYNSKKVTITNSNFVNSYLFGVILANASGQHGQSVNTVSGRVENNLFKDIKSNGLVLYQTQAPEDDPIIIKGNTFINNHRENVYLLCGPNGQSGNEPCAGGQLYLANDVANIKIENNIIKNGSSLYATGGIEFGNLNISSVDVIGNEIYNNNMWGIYINPNPNNVSNILISKNKVYNNGLLPQYRGVNISIPHNASVVQSSNCFTSSCTP